jgi:hypothetical protein
MKQLRRLPMLAALLALSGTCFAARQAPQTAAPEGQPAPAPAPTPAAAPAPQELPQVCLDAQTSDNLIQTFADRLKETITASGVMSLGSDTDACSLQLHVPGNLLRFQTAGGVMVSTVVIVASATGRYLSTSISACRASNLKPCAVRAVAAVKLALLLKANGGT